MPDYQQALGVVSGSSGTPCANAGGDCREVPDVSADADPSSGYIVYDTVNGFGVGTPGRDERRRAAVGCGPGGRRLGRRQHRRYGALNPALYLLAQQSPGTYLNDVTSGNNDYNATAGGQYPAMPATTWPPGSARRWRPSWRPGSPPSRSTVVVSGTQPYGGPPTFSATANYAGSGAAPFGVTLNTSGLTCTTVGTSTAISPSLALGQYTAPGLLVQRPHVLGGRWVRLFARLHEHGE